MRVLLTGANGFVAPYLARDLSRHGHEVFLSGREPAPDQQHPYFLADLTHAAEVSKLVQWARPDAVVHLAGISNVAGADAAQRAPLIADINITATHHICSALHEQNRACALLFVSTGLVYQPIQDPDFQGYDEQSPLGPVNDYGWSKLAAEAIARIYQSDLLKVYVVRPFNHIGPGQDQRFVAPSLAKRIIDAKSGSEIPVGDLSARRDFTDVRDVVRAYRLILERQPEERTFVLGSGVARPVMDIFRFFVEYSRKNVAPKSADSLLRAEHSVVFGKAALAKDVLGWVPEIPLQTTLQELYDHILSQGTKPT